MTTTLPTTAQISISIVEDHPLYRDALARAIDDPPVMVVHQAVRTVRALGPVPVEDSIVVLDYHLPELRGADAIR